MNNLIYIGSFSRLLLTTFGNVVNEEFLNKELPFIIYDYDEMKRNCSDVCEKLDYEYVDIHLYENFYTKWRKLHRNYHKENYESRRYQFDSRRHASL